MSINPTLVKESLEREACKKIRKGENLSNIIYASVGEEIIYSSLEDYLPMNVYIQLVKCVNEWMKEKIVFA